MEGSVDELHQSLKAMGVLQYLCGVAFLIFYCLAFGNFLGTGSRVKVTAVAALAAGAFIAMSALWVHGVMLIALAVLGVAAYLLLAWMLAVLCQAALQRGGHPAMSHTQPSAPVVAKQSTAGATPEALPAV